MTAADPATEVNFRIESLDHALTAHLQGRVIELRQRNISRVTIGIGRSIAPNSNSTRHSAIRAELRLPTDVTPETSNALTAALAAWIEFSGPISGGPPALRWRHASSAGAIIARKHRTYLPGIHSRLLFACTAIIASPASRLDVSLQAALETSPYRDAFPHAFHALVPTLGAGISWSVTDRMRLAFTTSATRTLRAQPPLRSSRIALAVAF